MRPRPSTVDSVLDGIAALIAHSLVRPDDSSSDDPLFVMLETIREYGVERLVESGEADAVQRRYTAYWCAMAERAEPGLKGRDQVRWRRRLERDLPNLRAALTGAARQGEVETGLRLATALTRFWWMSGHAREGCDWLEGLLARSGAIPPAVRAGALTGIGLLAWAHGDYPRAISAATEGLTSWRQLGDPAGAAMSLRVLGIHAYGQGDYAGAASLFEESLTLFRVAGDAWGVANVVLNLGLIACLSGDLDRSDELLAEGTRLSRQAGDGYHLIGAASIRAQVAIWRGDFARAREAHRESATGLLQLGDRRGFASELRDLALAAAAVGEMERAARLAGAEAALREATGAPLTPVPEARRYERELDKVRAALGETAFAMAWAGGRSLPPEQAIAEAAAAIPDVVGPPAARSRETTAAELTRRETEVLRLLTRRLTNKEIAGVLSISPRTAMNHVASILAKLGVASRREAADWASRHGLD
jgi:DNA-binding CsgD family transcriptional regulator